jgi:hypothetical protein
MVCLAAVAGTLIAWELFYYFTGSRWSSPLWWSFAPLPVLAQLLLGLGPRTKK